jgi:hypothetical protein
VEAERRFLKGLIRLNRFVLYDSTWVIVATRLSVVLKYFITKIGSIWLAWYPPHTLHFRPLSYGDANCHVDLIGIGVC